MNLRTRATALGLLTLLVGCVVAPVNRTYFEPNPADGTPTRSASCGYHRAAEDQLKRDIEGITLSVLPRYKEGQPLAVYVLLGRTSKTVELDPKKFEVRFGSAAVGEHPATTNVKDAGPYFFKSIDYVFPPSLVADDIAVIFLPGFIKLDGREVAVAPFRFRKVIKLDVYYGSINC
jgi:hypothetical protein